MKKRRLPFPFFVVASCDESARRAAVPRRRRQAIGGSRGNGRNACRACSWVPFIQMGSGEAERKDGWMP